MSVKSKECKFKVGDIVRGKKDNRYSITNERMTCGRVESVSVYHGSFYMDIRVLEHEFKYHEGGIYTVVATEDRFELVESAHNWKVLIIPDSSDNNITKAMLYNDNKVVKTVTTKKHPDDAYDAFIAAHVLTHRLFDVKETEKEDTKVTEPERKFKPGDVVDYNYYGKVYRGEVICYDSDGAIGVDFKFKYDDMSTHSLNGRLSTSTGYWIYESNLKKVY